jgi:nitrite reductase/ring-hydroxylating ferredoxin subunit
MSMDDGEGEWMDVAPVGSLTADGVTGITVRNCQIALYRVGDDIYATDNVCTHAYAELSAGFLEGYEIECPLHGGRFDIRSGQGLCAPITEDLRVYTVRVLDGRVQILAQEIESRPKSDGTA